MGAPADLRSAVLPVCVQRITTSCFQGDVSSSDDESAMGGATLSWILLQQGVSHVRGGASCKVISPKLHFKLQTLFIFNFITKTAFMNLHVKILKYRLKSLLFKTMT